MSTGTGDWNGRAVERARNYMAQLLPAQCARCGDMVMNREEMVVGHRKSRAAYPELTHDPTNWQHEHRECSERSGHEAKLEKAGRFFPETSPADLALLPFPHTEAKSLPPLPSTLRGCATPRLFTPPLADLSLPENSAGHECIEWSEEHLGIELLPWQKWFLIHALELNPDGSFRFRTVLLLVSRQNGKTTVIECLTAWLLATRPDTMVLGTSTAVELAREPWSRVADHCEDLGIATRITRGSIDTSIHTANGSRYKVAAATRRGGRSLSVDVLLLDELREILDDWEAYNALSGTTTAKPNALTLAFSNAGDYRSVVLNGLRDSALDGADPTLGIFEWSAPEDAALDDEEAAAQANPALGVTITGATLTSKRAQMPESGYRTEHLCQRVDSIEPGDVLVTPMAWDSISTTRPTGTPTAVAVEAWFGEGLTVAYAHVQESGSVVVHTEPYASLSDARTAIQASGYTGVTTVGASLLADPALRGLRVRAGQGRVTAAVTDLRRLLGEGAVQHTGGDHLTKQVQAVRTAGGAEGLRVLSKSRADAIKASVWAIREARKPKVGTPRILLPK